MSQYIIKMIVHKIFFHFFFLYLQPKLLKTVILGLKFADGIFNIVNQHNRGRYDFHRFLIIQKFKNLSAKYYQENNKKKTTKYLSKEEKEKKEQHGCERYKNLRKNGLIEYRKK